MKIYLVHGLAIIALGLATSACQVSKTKEGKMPKVAVSEGQLPAYNVQGPSVEVGSKTETVKVPTVHVTAPNQKK
jgi:hypothetical protein